MDGNPEAEEELVGAMQTIQERIKIHDRHQFEIKHVYPLSSQNGRALRYTVELYLFIPQSLDINPESRRKEEFYRDLQSRIRWQTPVCLLESLLCSEESILARLRARMSELGRRPDDPKVQERFVDTLKLCCSIVKSALRDEIEFCCDSCLTGERIDRLENNTQELLSRFRGLRPLLQVPHLDPRYAEIYDFGDEYISLVAEYYFASLAESLSDTGEISRKLRKAVLRLAAGEAHYRRKRGFSSVISESDSNEAAIYRMRVLKKIMGSILYLRTSRSADGRFAEELLTSLSAGVAMFLALMLSLLGRHLVADVTAWFVAIAVICYIVRDRIKDSCRFRFVGWARRFFFDYSTRISDAHGRRVGTSKELFSFIRESALPPEVAKLRARSLVVELANAPGENIVYYKKKIVLRAASSPSGEEYNGVVDIVRMSIRHLLDRMDDPIRSLLLPQSGGVRRVNGHCVYHLNLVLRYAAEGNPEEYRKFRLILDQNGIVRIEQ